MPLQNIFWIAGAAAEKKEVLLLFLHTERKSLLIIEKNSKAAQSIIEALYAESDLPYTLKLTSGCETTTFEGSSDTTKKIILHTALDSYSLHLLSSTKSALAIFT